MTTRTRRRTRMILISTTFKHLKASVLLLLLFQVETGGGHFSFFSLLTYLHISTPWKLNSFSIKMYKFKHTLITHKLFPLKKKHGLGQLTVTVVKRFFLHSN